MVLGISMLISVDTPKSLDAPSILIGRSNHVTMCCGVAAVLCFFGPLQCPQQIFDVRDHLFRMSFYGWSRGCLIF